MAEDDGMVAAVAAVAGGAVPAEVVTDVAPVHVKGGQGPGPGPDPGLDPARGIKLPRE